MFPLHPFTLLVVAAALPSLAWILPPPWGPAGALAVALVLCLTASPLHSPSPHSRRGGWGVRFAVVRGALLTAAPFWLFLLLLHEATRAVIIGLKLTTMIASFLWLIAILRPARLVEAMVATGWPVTAAFLLSATLSAVPRLRERAGHIVDAQRCRGLATHGGPLARLRALRALALPLILSALHDVDERALALETRGLTHGARRTPLAPPPDPAAQRLARWAILLGCVAALVWRIT